VRFFQANYAPTGRPQQLAMYVSWLDNGAQRHRAITLVPGTPAQLGITLDAQVDDFRATANWATDLK